MFIPYFGSAMQKQKQLIPAAVVVAAFLVLLWRVVRVESDLADLQQRLSQGEPAPTSLRKSSPTTSDRFPTEVMSPSDARSSSFNGGFAQSLRSQSRRSDPAGSEDAQVALENRIAELEGAVSEIGQAWNQFADEEDRKRLKSQTRAWSPAQAVGAPDTAQDGDRPTAWASREPDGGMEWLQTQYAQPVEVAQVHVRESYNPGAVVKITGVTQAGAEVVLWQGNEPVLPAPADQVFNVRPGIVVGSVKVHLDTRKVPGWNEIDAVELVGRDGTRQWANDATASSTYANLLGQ
jgi:hypothetical protein